MSARLTRGLNGDQIAKRIREAADVHKRYSVRVGPDGFRSNWPEVVRSAGEIFANAVAQGRYDDMKATPATPSADEIERMDEVLVYWLPWLIDESPSSIDKDASIKLVWAWANRMPWWALCQRFHFSEPTGRARLAACIALISACLNKIERPLHRIEGRL